MSSAGGARPLYNHQITVRCLFHCSSMVYLKWFFLFLEKFVNFKDLIQQRRDEAYKSLVIQVSSDSSYQELYNYCSQFGEIKSAFHYKIQEEQSHFIVLEYKTSSECQDALHHSQFNDDNSGVPAISPFMWFKASNTKKSKTRDAGKQTPPALIKEETKLIANKSLNDMIASANNLDDQMLIVHRVTCLNELCIRLRFLAARQMETALSGMFPQVKAHPFGSSVNGFGKMGCDLDLILRVNLDNQEKKDSRLIFHAKTSMTNERTQMQRQMETLGDIMHLFLPGISNVRRILQARVPIIKYNHECLDLEIDLSMNSLSGLYMSELLYLYGELDCRVRPLVFCIRKWANATGLTNPSPGRWISNFSLTVLVLFFLQALKEPILPPMNLLIKSASTQDIKVTDDNINCTFLRDLNQLKFIVKNKDPLGYLLIQFFEFYSQFDFSNRAVSLLEGKSILKADHSALWIVNPLEPLLNVSKNVSLEELERFKFELRNAAWILDESHQKSDEPWGLLNLFRANHEAAIRPQMFYKSRLVDVSDLFSEQEISANIRFKNASVKSQVESIQKAKREVNKEIFSKLKLNRR